jgi:hypothetical protein
MSSNHDDTTEYGAPAMEMTQGERIRLENDQLIATLAIARDALATIAAKGCQLAHNPVGSCAAMQAKVPEWATCPGCIATSALAAPLPASDQVPRNWAFAVWGDDLAQIIVCNRCGADLLNATDCSTTLTSDLFTLAQALAAHICPDDATASQ